MPVCKERDNHTHLACEHSIPREGDDLKVRIYDSMLDPTATSLDHVGIIVTHPRWCPGLYGRASTIYDSAGSRNDSRIPRPS